MQHIKQHEQGTITGGESGFEFLGDSHGQLELGLSFQDHYFEGQLSSESSFCSHADLKTEVSVNTQGSFSGYIGINASW